MSCFNVVWPYHSVGKLQTSVLYYTLVYYRTVLYYTTLKYTTVYCPDHCTAWTSCFGEEAPNTVSSTGHKYWICRISRIFGIYLYCNTVALLLRTTVL